MPFHVEQRGGVPRLVEVEFIDPPQPTGHPRKVKKRCDDEWVETVIYGQQEWEETALQAWDKWRAMTRRSIRWHKEAAAEAEKLLQDHLTDGG